MNSIEKIQTYIKRTGVKYSAGSPYGMDLNDMFGLRQLANNDLVGALILAFEYMEGQRESGAPRREARRVSNET